MRTTIHRTVVVAECPNGGKDVYDAEFHLGPFMREVEVIQAAIDSLTKEPIFQEELTDKLSRKLKCRVVTRGKHSRFETEVDCDGESS